VEPASAPEVTPGLGPPPSSAGTADPVGTGSGDDTAPVVGGGADEVPPVVGAEVSAVVEPVVAAVVGAVVGAVVAAGESGDECATGLLPCCDPFPPP
jgi:hypothetical protein